MQALIDSKTLSAAGADWIRCVLDPFADTPNTLMGVPDVNGNRSIVQMRQSSVQVSSPSGAAYSARVWATGFNADVPMRMNPTSAGSLPNPILGYNSDNPYEDFYPVMVEAWEAGQNPNASLASANLTRTGLLTKTTTSGGRLVALGFEVHNTTPKLTASGTAVMCSLPNLPRFQATELSDNAVIPRADIAVNANWILQAPSTLDQAIVSPGSVQWPAIEGCYCVAKMVGANAPQIPGRECFAFYDSDTDVNWVSVRQGNGGFHTPYERNEFTMPTAVFLGLSAETTLTVTCKAYYEVFPNFDNVSLVPLSTPSPPFDSAAMKLYSKIVADLPVAVQVKMNPMGEYYNMVLGAVKRAVPFVAPLLARVNPAFGAAAMTLGGVAAALPRARVKKQQQNPPGQGRKGKRRAQPHNTRGWGATGGA